MAINSEVRSIFVNEEKRPIVDGSFNWTHGGKERAEVMGSGGLLGNTEQNVPGTCTWDEAYIAGSDPFVVDDLNGLDSDQIRVVWDNGAEWLLTKAFSNTSATGTAGSGTYTVAATGNPWQVVVS